MTISAPGRVTRAATGPDTAPRSRLVRLARRVVPVAFAVLMLTAAGDILVTHFTKLPSQSNRRSVPTVPTSPPLGSLPSAGAPVLAVPAAQRVEGKMSSLAALARHLPAGTLTLDAAGWRLHRPIALAAGGRLDIEHRRLSLVPGAFIEAAAGGTVYLAHTRIVGVGPAGRPDAAPTPRRGFLLAVGGRMQLVHDQLLDLGHVADGAAGITFRNAAPGSRVTRSVLAGSYTGIQITQSAGVRVVRDHISTITADAVDIGSYSRDIVVAANRIAGIGGHGILVSGAAERITVTRNDISNCHQDGIALYNRVTAVTVTDDRITRSLDGIVLTAVTGNTLTHNEVSQVRRYGFRVSTGSHRDVLLGNQVTHTPVGIYLYRHAHNEQLLANQFARDQLDLRIRQDSSRNTIRPIPSNSIIGR